MEKNSESDTEFSARFFWPTAPLSRYFFCFVLTEVNLPEGKSLSELYVPAWGMVSWRDRPAVSVHFQSGEIVKTGTMAALGPFDHTVTMQIGPIRQWTAVMLPAAWTKYVSAPACNYANRTVDIQDDPLFSGFHELDTLLFNGEPDCDAELAMIHDMLMPLANQPCDPIEMRINKILTALMDAKISKVGELAEFVGVTRRTLERTCDKAFGLPPKVLLRRQRFFRSLAQHLINREGSWTDAIDHLYHDQPQFVREFRQFTGMSPSEYAQLERPMKDPGMINSLRYWQEINWLDETM